MNIETINWMKETRHLLPDDLGKILEVGSLNVNGSSREIYTQCESYTGIDIRKGLDVDIVMNGHDLVSKFGEDSFDTVICMNTMEHDNKFWLTQEAINKVLVDGGYYIFSVPAFIFQKHNHPKDYWRMSREAVTEVIMEGYEILEMKILQKAKGRRGKMVDRLILAMGKKEKKQ